MKNIILLIIIMFQIQNTGAQITDKQFWLDDILSSKNVIEIQTFDKQYNELKIELLNGTDSIFMHKRSSTYFNDSNQPHLIINFEKLDTATVTSLKHDQFNNLIFTSIRWVYGQAYKDDNWLDFDSLYINQDSFYIERYASRIRNTKINPMTLRHRMNYSENGILLSVLEFEKGKIVNNSICEYNEDDILLCRKDYGEKMLLRVNNLIHDTKGRLINQVVFDSNGNKIKEIDIEFKSDLNFTKKIYDSLGELELHIETFESRNRFGDLVELIEFDYLAKVTTLKTRKYIYR